MHAQHVAAREEGGAVGEVVAAVRGRTRARALTAAARDNAHAEGIAEARNGSPDRSVAENAQRAPVERASERGLPATLAQPPRLERHVAHRVHDQRPRELGGRDRRAARGGHRNAATLARGEVDVAGGVTGLADEAELRQAIDELRGDRRPRADEHDGVGIREAPRQRVDAGHRVVVDLDVEAREPRKAVQVPDRVLIVVGDDDAHHVHPTPAMRRRIGMGAFMRASQRSRRSSSTAFNICTRRRPLPCRRRRARSCRCATPSPSARAPAPCAARPFRRRSARRPRSARSP